MSRVAVIGAGAIGSVLASQLTAAGNEVTLCVRTSIEGVTVEGPLGVGAVPAAVATSPDQVEPVEWVVVATKIQDTAGTEPWLARLAPGGTDVLVAQNGVGHRERVGPLAPEAIVLPALVQINMETIDRTHFRHRVGEMVMVPEGDAAGRLRELLSGSQIELQVAPDFHTAAWRKLIGNLVANPITALTMRRLEVFGEERIVALAAAVLREAVAVGSAEGAAVGEDDVEATLKATASFPESGTSMYFDRLEGRPLEYRGLVGYLVETAAGHGIPTPVNEALLALLAAVDGRPLAPELPGG